MYKLQVNFEKRQIHLRELVGRGSKGSLTEKLLGLDKYDGCHGRAADRV